MERKLVFQLSDVKKELDRSYLIEDNGVNLFFQKAKCIVTSETIEVTNDMYQNSYDYAMKKLKEKEEQDKNKADDFVFRFSGVSLIFVIFVIIIYYFTKEYIIKGVYAYVAIAIVIPSIVLAYLLFRVLINIIGEALMLQLNRK